MKIMLGDHLSKNLQKGLKWARARPILVLIAIGGEGRVLPYFRPHSFFKVSGLKQEKRVEH